MTEPNARVNRVREIELPWRCSKCGVKLGGAAYVRRGENDPTVCIHCEKDAAR